MAQHHQSQGKGESKAELAAAIIILTLLMAMTMWTLFGDETLAALTYLSRWLMIPPHWVGQWVPWLLPEWYIDQYNRVATHINQLGLRSLTAHNAKIVYTFLGQTYYFTLLPVVLFAAWWLWRHPVVMRYTGMLSLDALIQRNLVLYPHIRPAFFHDLLNEDPDDGPFARALDYRRFAERNGLLLDENDHVVLWRNWFSTSDTPASEPPDETGDASKPRIPIPYPAVALSAPATRDVFAKQLGLIWPKRTELPGDVPPFVRALFGILAARTARDTKAADNALHEMNRSWTERKDGNHKMKCKKALKLVPKYIGNAEVQDVLQRHTHQNTIMSAMLSTAQLRAGAFHSALFLWLKVVDRPLWYAMNQVGRRVAWPEAGGVRAHMLAENKRGCAISDPVVESAIRACADHLTKESYLDRAYIREISPMPRPSEHSESRNTTPTNEVA